MSLTEGVGLLRGALLLVLREAIEHIVLGNPQEALELCSDITPTVACASLEDGERRQVECWLSLIHGTAYHLLGHHESAVPHLLQANYKVAAFSDNCRLWPVIRGHASYNLAHALLFAYRQNPNSALCSSGESLLLCAKIASRLSMQAYHRYRGVRYALACALRGEICYRLGEERPMCGAAGEALIALSGCSSHNRKLFSLCARMRCGFEEIGSSFVGVPLEYAYQFQDVINRPSIP